MEKESDYIKRSIEFHKYIFSSSAALLLIMAWKILTEVNVLTSLNADRVIAAMTILITVGVGIICMNSYLKWINLVKELK